LIWRARRFYIFGLVLYPQDFIYLTGLLVICGVVAVFVHGRGGAFVVWLCLPANGVQRNVHVDRAQD
jgi:polyferredoxin